jgi:hypothetical protein
MVAAVGAIVAIIGLVVGLLWPAASHNAASADGSLTTAVKAAQVQLTVDHSAVDCVGLVTKYGGQVATLSDGSKTPKFSVGAEQPVGQNGRLWSDAVNVPLNPQTVEAEQASICADPAQAAMVQNGIGSKKVGDKSVADLNGWMTAQGSPEAISQWAQDCMSQDVETHIQCAKTMALTATLVGRFQSEGVKNATTTWNYHLASGGLVVGQVPPFELNPTQYAGFFLVISVTEKTGGCFLRLGFNVGTSSPNGGDQRLAGLPCQTPTPTAPPAAPTTPGKPPTSSVPPTHETTPPTSPPRTTPTTQKPRLSWDCQQNGVNCPPGVTPSWHQPVQQNPSNAPVGPTPGYVPPAGGGNPPPPSTVPSPATTSPPATRPPAPAPTTSIVAPR